MNLQKIKIIFLAFIISGCGVRERDRDVLRIRLKEDPTTLDPLYIVDVVGGSVAAKLYSGLVRFDEGCEIIPDIAESWEISDNGLVYTFKLRIDAELVKKTFERVIKESPRKWIFDKVNEFNVIDDKTLQIVLKEPFSPFLSLLAMPNAYVAAGPFKLALWEHDKRLVLEPNPFYFGRPAKVKRIEYHIIPEEFTAKTEFELGNLDIMELSPLTLALSDPRPAWVPRGRGRGEGLYSQVGLNVYYIGFNCKKFRDVRMRQAFNYAIDKKVIIKSLLKGQAIPAWGPVPPSILKSEAYYYQYLPNKAKGLLRQKGKLKIYVRAQAQAIQIAEVIQYYLSKIGIVTEIVPLEWSAFKKAVNEGEPDMFLMSWWADYPSPENFLFPTFHSSNLGAGGNRAQFKNRTIDKLIEESQKEMDPVKREKLYRVLQRYINRQAPWIFLWHTKELVIVQPWVKGFKLYPVYNSDKGTDVYLHN